MARRWIFYLAINILVSAATMLGVLALWDRAQRPAPMVAPTLAVAYTNAPTSTPTFPPTTTPHVYIVQAGDVLGAIAVKVNVDVETLITLNNISNPDALQPGDTLILPTPEPQTTPTTVHPTVTPAADEKTPWPALVAVISPGNLGSEALRIANMGPTINMKGWKIRTPKGQEYVFGDFSLVTGGAVMIHSASGKDSPIDRYWSFAAALWQAGDEVLLLDAVGNVRSVFIIPAA
jgi:LysM repeat protein